MNAPPHPADFLNEVLMPATGRSDGEVARLLGISLPVFYTILTREKPISAMTAAMLGRLFNTGEGFWIKMQADYDRFMATNNVVDSGVCAEGSTRASSLSQSMTLRQLPTPASTSFTSAPHEAEDDFQSPDVASWGQVMHDSGAPV